MPVSDPGDPGVPWQGRIARALGLADHAPLADARKRQATDDRRPLLDHLALASEERTAVEDEVRRRGTEVGREVEDEAFASWALARGLPRAALEDARRLVESHPGSRL